MGTKGMYKKILVPVDGSEPSNFALEHAINLSKQCKGNHNTSSSNIDVIILYVIPEMPTSIGLLEGPMRSPKTGELISFSEYVKEMYALIKLNSEKKLTNLKNKYEYLGINMQTKVIADAKGSIVDNIMKHAEDEKVDLIVIGNIGLGGFSKFRALGSVSRSLTEKAICPILIIHSKEP
jgi:nucleotide-binding universal stress UspA family protein